MTKAPSAPPLRLRPLGVALLLLAGALPGALGARQPATADTADTADAVDAVDAVEPGSVEAIARDTTDPAFSSPWVSYLPDSPTVPSPVEVLGRVAGAAGDMWGTAEIHRYLRALAEASPRVHLETIGESWEGREILLVAIADEVAIASLGELKAASAALADPRRTDPDAAARVIAGGARPFYYFNAGLHADETGSPEMTVELAYRLAVSEHPMIRRIRERTVVLINPVANPDGRDKMTDWFDRHLKGKTDFDTLPRISPPYWGRYVFVDQNRDAHQLSQPETQAVAKMFFDWHPQVVHDLHEAIALLLTWNGTGPYNPHLEPTVLSEFLGMSFWEMSTLAGFGMPGVWTWDFGEGFGHHYLDSIAMNHNAIGRGYETWGNGTQETVRRVLDASDTTREWYRPWPPPRDFLWSMRDNTNYMQTAALAILDYTAKNADELLHRFYRQGHSSWRKGVEGPLLAYAIPADQGDPARVAAMVERLIDQGIEVHRVPAGEGELALREGRFPAGTFVVRLDQPYRNYAVDLLSPQRYPEDAPRPYDDVSWALPVHYGLEAVEIEDPAIRDAPLEAISAPVTVAGGIEGSGPVWLLRDTGQEGLLAARYRLSDPAIEVRIAERSFDVGGSVAPAGSWLVRVRADAGAGEVVRRSLEQVARELGLRFESLPTLPDVPTHEADPPRLGVWAPWADTDSIGWIRYTLDQRQVPYRLLRDEEIRAGRPGDLRERVDVILYGHVDLDLQGQIHGLATAQGPLAFTATERWPSHGAPVESEDITGGPGWAGLANLQAFVHAGGALITLGRGSDLVLQTGLVRFVKVADVDAHTPGAEIRATFARPEHPLAYGYDAETSFFRGLFTAYDTPRRWLRMAYCTGCLDGPEDPRFVVATWGGAEGAPMVVSGGGRNEENLRGRPAILDVADGDGHYVVFNFNPLHRDLNRSDHRLVWNAILSWNDALDYADREER
ncbi:MAG TPA: M14 family zinc carboxypeptidase [Thermoanaerobaculia bacterium]|nr:M14 family zinc carboxypeptidase [Thermoanaerobaculia bacterium]